MEKTIDQNNNQKFLFYTGKGGVGKTTLACAMAVKLTEEGNKVLLITDVTQKFCIFGNLI